MNTKLTLSLDKNVIERAKLYAKEHEVSVSFLVENYLLKITSDYKEDKLIKVGFLKENNYINISPSPRKYVYNQIKVFKQFNLTPITKKILSVNNNSH